MVAARPRCCGDMSMRPIAIRIATIAIVSLAVFQTADGQSGGGTFNIDHVTVTGGGALSGGTFGLKGTVGQPLVSDSSGGTFALKSGARVLSDSIFANGFESQ